MHSGCARCHPCPPEAGPPVQVRKPRRAAGRRSSWHNRYPWSVRRPHSSAATRRIRNRRLRSARRELWLTPNSPARCTPLPLTIRKRFADDHFADRAASLFADVRGSQLHAVYSKPTGRAWCVNQWRSRYPKAFIRAAWRPAPANPLRATDRNAGSLRRRKLRPW